MKYAIEQCRLANMRDSCRVSMECKNGEIVQIILKKRTLSGDFHTRGDHCQPREGTLRLEAGTFSLPVEVATHIVIGQHYS